MSFVTDRTRSSIEELIQRLKSLAEDIGMDGIEPVIIFRRNEYDDEAVVTPLSDEAESWEEALIRTFYRLFLAKEEQMYWVGAICESYGLVKDGVLLNPVPGEIQPGELEEDFINNPFSEVTEGVSVFLACENGETEFMFYPSKRDDNGKAVFGKPWVRSADTTADGISESEVYLARFQEVLAQSRAGELTFDEEDE